MDGGPVREKGSPRTDAEHIIATMSKHEEFFTNVMMGGSEYAGAR